jgi:hypothetical protein
MNSPIAQSLTIRGMCVMILAFLLTKLAPAVPVEQVQDLANAIATAVLGIGALMAGIGRGRHGFADDVAPPSADDPQGFLGKQGWRDVRGTIRSAGQEVMMAAIEAAVRRVFEEREQANANRR